MMKFVGQMVVLIFGVAAWAGAADLEDKGLEPAWVESLTQRGGALDAKIRGSKKDDTLQYIGMPVGGIGCGTVYLGGDGRLWVWDIFNKYRAGVMDQESKFPPELEKFTGGNLINAANGANYVNPFTPDTWPPAFKQGFGIQVGDRFLRMEEKDWTEVEFEGNWPIGSVQYRDSAMPVEVALCGFSPFIPLNVEDSSVPLTFMEFTVRNTSAQPVTADLSGWLENAVGIETRKSHELQMETVRTTRGELNVMQHSASNPGEDAPQTKRADIIIAAAGRPNTVTADMVKDAVALANAGAQLLLLEAVTPPVAKYITELLEIPVYSIGAGIDCGN